MESRNVLSFFNYNWQIRDKWFEWCKEISEEELLKERTGGHKGILQTLFHIVDVEQRWMRGIANDETVACNFSDRNTLDKVIQFSEETKEYSLNFLYNYTSNRDNDLLSAVNKKGEKVSHLYIEILLHLSVHEVHHTGQLSVWARELGKEPISANLIGLNLFND
jgi:uncharacterized damage-inducible protein DinB